MTFVRRHKTRTSSIRMIKTEARKLSLKICGKEKKIAKTDLCNKEQEEREGTLGQPAATKKPKNIAGG